MCAFERSEKGMDFFMKNIIVEYISKEIIISLIVVLIGLVVYAFSKKIINKLLEKNQSNNKITKKKKTYIKLFDSIIKYIILIAVLIIVLQVNGINVTSIIAGLGLVSVIAGFALQDALKDVIMGVNIIIDNYYSVGDVLKLDDTEGKVMEIGLKTTKLLDINNGNILVIANREINKALSLSTQFDIDIPLPYEEKLEDMEKIIAEIIVNISKLSNVKNVEYRGVNEFSDSAIMYKIRLYGTKVETNPQLKRDANGIIKLELDKNNISIPYTQIDVHQK